MMAKTYGGRAIGAGLFLVMVFLGGFCSHSNAEARCSQLTTLRSKAAEAAKQMTGVPTWERCEAYSRFSLVWDDIVRYANANREPCDISSDALSELERRYREAARMRENVCASRSLAPFPPEKILR
ncbi:hypothetical protein QA635_15050 [Bradyrhizobium brasilense]|uniref:hypothetical protein n=1 Tax=Bradyrhizobium brasilense TaxID=1419277 RepID=UPI0024B21E38|nr:hypothetical protein [Bradyrhizobium australafricanum]WFU35645.1 hypothetical protein QA635_15050 [Bradyrhizobium australafricanum]